MMTRRKFFENSILLSGSAFVVPTILPSSLFGAEAPSNRINVAMIGCGRQAMSPNIVQMLKSPNAQVIAVCDVDNWRRENARLKVNEFYAAQKGVSYNGCRADGDYRKILAMKDVDAVMISSPDHWHVPMAIDAIRAGKHISLEKPISTCIAHSKRLIKMLKQHPEIITRNDSEFRTLPAFIRCAEIVRSGRIGTLKRIQVSTHGESAPESTIIPTMPVPPELDYDMWLGPCWEVPYTMDRVHAQKEYGKPGWMRIADYCNGQITNWGAHLLSVVQWAKGSEYTGPVSVEGTGEYLRGLWNTLNKFDLKYKYADGVELDFNIDKAYIIFEGTDGWVKIAYKDNLTASSEKILEPAAPGEFTFGEILSDKEDFLMAIKNKKPSLEPLETAHRTISMCQMGLIAVETGNKLTWDPVKEDFVGDNAASALLDRPIREKYFKW